MPSPATIICLVLLAGTIGGFYLWWKSIPAEPRDPASAPDTYTSNNVRAGETYHVEQNGRVQEFEVLSVHWSGYFLIRVEPEDGHELDREPKSPNGWTRALPSNRLIEAERLLELLPDELRFAPSYN